MPHKLPSSTRDPSDKLDAMIRFSREGGSGVSAIETLLRSTAILHTYTIINIYTYHHRFNNLEKKKVILLQWIFLAIESNELRDKRRFFKFLKGQNGVR